MIKLGDDEVAYEVKTFAVEKKCPECYDEKRGTMRPREVGGSSVVSVGPDVLFRHRCRECDHEDDYWEKYPRFQYTEGPS